MLNPVGVFTQSDLRSLIKEGGIETLSTFSDKHVGEASVDVTITSEIYQIERVIQPDETRGETVRSLLNMMGAQRMPVGSVAKAGYSYLAKASINLHLLIGMYAFFNARSTLGRLFVFVRTLADKIFMFDSGDKRETGYSGEIWLVIEPLAIPIVLNSNECFSQMRVFDGDTRFKLPDLKNLRQTHDILYDRVTQQPQGSADYFRFGHDGSIFCTMFAKGDKPIGYQLKKGVLPPIDLSSRNLDPQQYFRFVMAEQLEKGNENSWGVKIRGYDYYLLPTYEMICIPTMCSAELVALDRRLVDAFVHFAGYFDPGFWGTGTLEILSPRTIFVRHQQPVACFIFEWMKSQTSSYDARGSYARQIKATLPKQFREMVFA